MADTLPGSEPEIELYAARKKIFPKRTNGTYRRLKWIIMAVTLAIYYITPWLRWDRGEFAPDQAVLVDIANRRFYAFFIEIWPQEFYFVAGMLVMAGIGLFLVTSVVGRAWCGYTCPQTVWTDLFLVVERFFEGDRNARMKLDAGAAAEAIEREVAKPLGLSLHDAARGILAISDNAMIGAIRVVSVERGHDPRDFTLIAFGGAGPLHGTAVAELLGIRQVLIPEAPGVLCADGLLHADLRAEFSQALPNPGPVEAVDTADLRERLSAEALSWFDAEGVREADRQTETKALLRFRGQGSELAVTWDADPVVLTERFAQRHEALYGFRQSSPVELVALRVEARSAPAPRAKGGGDTPDGTDARIGTSKMALGSGSREVPVYDRTRLAPRSTVEGPAILSQLDTTTLVSDGWTATRHASGAVILRHGKTS